MWQCEEAAQAGRACPGHASGQGALLCHLHGSCTQTLSVLVPPPVVRCSVRCRLGLTCVCGCVLKRHFEPPSGWRLSTGDQWTTPCPWEPSCPSSKPCSEHAPLRWWRRLVRQWRSGGHKLSGVPNRFPLRRSAGGFCPPTHCGQPPTLCPPGGAIWEPPISSQRKGVMVPPGVLPCS